jgi:hypothetical protein
MSGGLFTASSRNIYCCSSKSCSWLLLVAYVDAAYISDDYVTIVLATLACLVEDANLIP